MSNTCQFTIRIDVGLKKEAQKKAKEKFGIGLGTLAKLFFKSFVNQSNIGFYVGDDEFEKKLDKLLKSSKVESALSKFENLDD